MGTSLKYLYKYLFKNHLSTSGCHIYHICTPTSSRCHIDNISEPPTMIRAHTGRSMLYYPCLQKYNSFGNMSTHKYMYLYE